MPWRGIYVPAVNQYLDFNEDGTRDVYFHLGTAPSPQISGVFYIDVSGGQRTLKSRDRGELQWLMNIERAWSGQALPVSDFHVGPDGEPGARAESGVVVDERRRETKGAPRSFGAPFEHPLDATVY